MNQIEVFINRLKKIGITLTFIGNTPWIYLDTVNSKKVKGKYLGNHGFTAFWYPVKPGESIHISNIGEVFNKIRETLKSN